MKDYWTLLRPHHYIKNLFVWVGFLFSGSTSLVLAQEVAATFLAFCLAASSVYVFNDIADRDVDRQHPGKRLRPIAIGRVSPRQASVFALCLALGSLALSVLAGWLVTTFVLAYLALNTAYSLGLKNIVILDVFLIAGGFMLRILAGTTGVGIPPSRWLLLTGLMLTLFLGFAKRRAELLAAENARQADRGRARRVLGDYSPAILDQFTGVTAACTVLSYGLYTVSAGPSRHEGTLGLFYTLPFVIYGIFRYLFLLHHLGRGNDTAKDLMQDRHLIATSLAWIVVTVAILR